MKANGDRVSKEKHWCSTNRLISHVKILQKAPETTWEYINDDMIFLFRWTIPGKYIRFVRHPRVLARLWNFKRKSDFNGVEQMYFIKKKGK